METVNIITCKACESRIAVLELEIFPVDSHFISSILSLILNRGAKTLAASNILSLLIRLLGLIFPISLDEIRDNNAPSFSSSA